MPERAFQELVIITKKSEIIQKHILSFYRTKNPRASFYDDVQDARGWDYEKKDYYYTPKHALKDLISLKYGNKRNYHLESKKRDFLHQLGMTDNAIDKHRSGASGLYRDLLVEEGAKMWSEINTEMKKKERIDGKTKTKINKIIRRLTY